MQDPTIFTPQLGDIHATMLVCGLAIVALVALAIFFNKNKHPDPRRRVLLPMLCYFAALLALMGFLGSFWSMFKYPKLEITATEMVINGQTNPIPSPANIRLENYTNSGLGPESRVLLVQTRDRKTWAFPEDRYPVTEIMRLLKK
jgi:uncharacterized membrane protein